MICSNVADSSLLVHILADGVYWFVVLLIQAFQGCLLICSNVGGSYLLVHIPAYGNLT